MITAFDVLIEIYISRGYTEKDAVQSIISNNLYGLDIDERASQLAYFAVMMRARKYDSRFFSRGIQPNVYTIAESNGIDTHALEAFINSDENIKKDIESVIADLHDAKEYGSIIDVKPVDFGRLNGRVLDMENDISLFADTVRTEIKPLIDVARVLSQKYDVVCTNPPYMGGSGMSAKLSDYVKKNYPDSKSDLFAVFIERCGKMIKKNGYQAMITQHAWMFLSSYEKLREKLLLKDTVNMAHFGARAFDEIGGEVVQTTAFVLRNSHIADYKGTYCRLIEPTSEKGKENMFLSGKNRYIAQQDKFSKIPGSPVAYWVSEKVIEAYDIGSLIGDVADVKIGMGTGKNEVFVREWWEVCYYKIDFTLQSIDDLDNSYGRYFPYNKGGEFRLWYGNLQEVLWFDNEGRALMNTMNGHRENGAYKWYAKEGVTWSFISSSNFGVRYMPSGCFFDVAGSTLFSQDNQYTLGFLSSKVCVSILKILNPTLNYQAGNIKNLPMLVKHKDKVEKIVNSCIVESQSDWDSYETSWDFTRHPLLRKVSTLSEAYEQWRAECNARFDKLKTNEEELNRIFIDIYGLQDELTPEVADKDVTVHRIYDTKDDIPESMKGSNYVRTKKDEVKSLISYAVGCMFGRYSLDIEGLVYAGGNFDTKYCRWIKQFGIRANEYIDENGQLIQGGWAGCTLWKYDGVRIDGKWVPASFAPDTNNIIPICDDEYFEDDIVGYFIRFIKKLYGNDTLEENLKFIADALEGKGSPREVIRNYFLNDFYADHCKMYQKRPIYWLFDSGKKNGFKALVYMHRYRPDTIARMRMDYIFEQQGRYKTDIEDLERRISTASTAERVKLTKQLAKLKEQDEELRMYEEKIHHLADQMIKIDLDDGVKHNYEIFKDVLAKIK